MTTPNCPNCASPLVAVDATNRPDTPPWLSPQCGRGWWNAELAASAVKKFRPQFMDFADADLSIRKAVRAEHAGARMKLATPAGTTSSVGGLVDGAR